MMLDPIRHQGLRPAELIARLQLAPTAVVADVGAGPGFLTVPLASAVPRGRVIATDVRADYLAMAAERTRAAGLHNVEIRTTPADDPRLAPGELDLALLCQVDQLLPDRVRYFRRLAAALKPNGRLALVNWARFRAADLEAATAAGFRLVDEWSPSAPLFLVVFSRTEP
jgi:trans-aconitate methyltransferase